MLSLIYELTTSARNRLYDWGALPYHKANLPVISVGNLSVGGNGKTPLCIYLYQLLDERGFSPVILMRGYGGTETGPHLVSGDDSPRRVGDEALLMAKRYRQRVLVCRSRVAGAKYIEEHKLGRVIILDDGFQHRALARDLDLICVDVSTNAAVESFKAGRVLPAGYFRENKVGGLKRANAILFSNRRIKPLELDWLALLPAGNKLAVFCSRIQSWELRSLENTALKLMTGQKIAAFTAIANPQGFVETLKDAGFQVEQVWAFKDHHQFCARDIAQAKESGLPLVCTEKDAVKLLGFEPGIFVLSTSIEVQGIQGESLEQFVLARLASATKRSAAELSVAL